MSTAEPPLVPRQYQNEIFQRACKENVIAALATASGKTFIASLLIKWIVSQPSLGSGKMVFFLVPEVDLVVQQRTAVEQQTQLRVGGFSGAMNINMDVQRWKTEFANRDVLVMTPQIMLNLLEHGFLSIASVSLLVIDEAHHAIGNHPFARIMNEHYHHIREAERRPKVLGLTASPIWNPKNPQKALSTLEMTMDAKVISVLENIAELEYHSPRAQEMIIKYPGAPHSHDSESPSLWDYFENLDDFKSYLSGDDFWDTYRQYRQTEESLGLHAADYYLFDMLTSRINAQIQAHVPAAYAPAGSTANLLHGGVRAIQTVLARHSSRFNPSSLIDMRSCTPKLGLLAKTLNDHHAQSPHLQAIIFVEQRHIASVLSWILPLIPELQWVKSQCLIGRKRKGAKAGKMSPTARNGLVQAFKRKEFNILVATSVGEEGLDFQSLSLVVRFDAVNTIVSRAQSRGRAREKNSSFVIMIQDDDHEQLARYQKMVSSEADIQDTYARDRDEDGGMDEESEEEEHTDGQRYTTAKGALLTYASAVSLLNNFCAFFQVDEFTSSLAPEYSMTVTSGFYQSSITLPSALPIPRNALSYVGPLCASKRRAKGGAAFEAVKSLHTLGVLDDHLLTVRKPGKNVWEGQDADGQLSSDITEVEKIMQVNVRDPWGNPWNGGDVWMHPILIRNKPVAGLVTGREVASDFPPWADEHGYKVQLGQGCRLLFADEEERVARLSIMDEYSREGIRWGISMREMNLGVATVMIVLLQANGLSPDYKAMRDFVREPQTPWTRETHRSQQPILARHYRKSRALLFLWVRNDLTPLSEPVLFPEQKNEEKGYPSYIDFYQQISGGPPPIGIREDDLMLEFKELKRAQTKVKVLRSFDSRHPLRPQLEGEPSKRDRMVIVPQGALFHLRLPLDILSIFHILPHLIRHIASYFRAQTAQHRLGLPLLDIARHVEALTLPSTGAGFDYQRLETLGDSCLKLATSVHLFTEFPHHHEGQLTHLRVASINNIYLLGRALKGKLFEYINGETSSVGKSWSIPLSKDMTYDEEGNPMVLRQVPSKAMQDCLEASLGAAWLSGGMDTVLKTGTALKLCFGGDVPWMERNYPMRANVSESLPAFWPIEEALGYRFRDSLLLSEALTHPSISTSETGSYNRLEFLGDALVELFVTQEIFLRWPNAQPGRLSCIRDKAVCNATLSVVAIKGLSLDKSVLHASPLLSHAMELARADFENVAFVDFVGNTWRYNPPKVLGDLTESVLGAVFVDSGFDLNKSFEVVAHVLGDVMEALYFDVPEGPVPEMLEYMAHHGCVQGSFRKQRSSPDALKDDCIAVLIHGNEVVPPVPAATVRLSKSHTCAKVLEALRSGEIDLKAICTCDTAGGDAKLLASPDVEMVPEEDFARQQWGSTTAEETMEDFSADLKRVIESDDVAVQLVESDEDGSEMDVN